ncbi:amidohydrolase [Lentzea sp. NBRC 105346]|uniref:amidase n=1 Tax=Lentzea sp. NBRC 105346 TaxID=3032205 RepID=UPI0024A0D796|nr:amidase [Lentzea sp. NBRC 105346]GLZ34999.1 amidohydrolase [Lentzea sp. NBRC 105346]
MNDSIREIAQGVREGRLDPVELAYVAVCRALETANLGAVVHLDADRARQAAEKVAREREGALAGVPLLVKEIIPVAGMPYRCGSRVFADRVATADAEIVWRARAAGAVIIGLSHTHEFAYGCTGTSNAEGPCRNPRDPARITGGSSSGSAAAVAAGVVPLALGTDTAGSVRIPAALCGVVGAKPARHTLPLDGIFPLSPSLDHAGVLTRSVADARYAIEVLGGGGSGPPEPPAPPRLGVLTNPEPLDLAAEVAAAYDAALGRLTDAGAELVEVRLPEWSRFVTASLDLQRPEAAAVHAATFPAQAFNYQPDVRERLEAAADVPGWRYVLAHDLAATLTAETGHVLSTVDAVVLPTVPISAPALLAAEAQVAGGWQSVRDLLLRNNRMANVTGHPAWSLPLPARGLPVGLQLVAADDRRMFAVAEWVERVAGQREGEQ